MLFDLAEKPKAWIEVAWPRVIPAEDDGLAVEGEHRIELLVEILDRDELKKLFPNLMGDKDTPPPSEIDIVMGVASDWRQAGKKTKILDRGKPVNFTRANVAKLIQKPMFGPAFTASYMAAVGGRVGLREKNSEGSPDNGRAAGDQAETTTTSSNATVSGSE